MTSNAAAAAASCVECQRRKQKVKIRSGRRSHTATRPLLSKTEGFG